ncbi:hypothetical protein [Klebsiella variicola]|uniref:hypothetical protein n=1 Tax=Klebsiella variicola TaxID=244366 RepID=UPI003006800F
MTTWQIILITPIFLIVIIFYFLNKSKKKRALELNENIESLKSEWSLIYKALSKYKGCDRRDIEVDVDACVERANKIQNEIALLDRSHKPSYITVKNNANSNANANVNGFCGNEVNESLRWLKYDETISVSASIMISYEDSLGALTERIVDVRKYNHHNEYFWGFCHLRKENRTFRIDRVKSVVDVETGEIISGLKRFLRKHRV